jgi:hypothetical protein
VSNGINPQEMEEKTQLRLALNEWHVIDLLECEKTHTEKINYRFFIKSFFNDFLKVYYALWFYRHIFICRDINYGKDMV